jgi:hypothetical protein
MSSLKVLSNIFSSWHLIFLFGLSSFSFFLSHIDVSEEVSVLISWVSENTKPVGKPNMTASDFLDHVYDVYGIELKLAQAQKLLHELGFSWKKLKIGYYKKKSKEQWIKDHRMQVVECLEYLDNSQLFKVYYQDESPFRKNIYQNCAWVRDDDVEDQHDERQKPGAGPGWNVSCFITEDMTAPVLFSQGEGVQVGYVLDSAKSSRTGKEDASAFLDVMEESFEELALQYPHQVPIVVIDGAGTHRTMEEGAWNPRQMNKKVPKDDAPVTMEMKLKELKLWNHGLSKIHKKCNKVKAVKKKKESSKNPKKATVSQSRPRRNRKSTSFDDSENNNNNGVLESSSDGSAVGSADEYDSVIDNEEGSMSDDYSLSADLSESLSESSISSDCESEYKTMLKGEAMDILLKTPQFLQQRLAVERLAEKHGCLVLFLPCASPVLNPIERFWRLIKHHVRRRNGVSKAELGDLIDEYLCGDFWCDDHLENMFELSRCYRKYFYLLDSGEWEPKFLSKHNISRPIAPSERRIRKFQKLGILEDICTINIRQLLGDPKCVQDVDMKKFGDYFHDMNVQRVIRKSL